MKLSREILSKLLEDEEVAIPNLCINAVEGVCYNALAKIKAVINNDSLSDFDCVEEIVRIFEEIGSDGGNRHDFG